MITQPRPLTPVAEPECLTMAVGSVEPIPKGGRCAGTLGALSLSPWELRRGCETQGSWRMWAQNTHSHALDQGRQTGPLSRAVHAPRLLPSIRGIRECLLWLI